MSQDRDPQEPPTTGHQWDGIEEYNNPLPRWWLWTFYATILWGIIYTILFPAWPLITGATPGVLGFSSRAELAADLTAAEDANRALDERLVSADLATIAEDRELLRYAAAGGGALYRTYCSQCHGAGAAGSTGYPNLLDDDWLWGGDLEALHTTISHGIRWEEDADTRYSQMPAYGEFFQPEEISAVVEYVLALSSQDHDAASAAAGAALFAENCAACHGEEAQGDREQGAPNLTDAIWLFGGDRDALTASVSGARFGIMPAWGTRLNEARIRQLALYVHQLGGGE